MPVVDRGLTPAPSSLAGAVAARSPTLSRNPPDTAADVVGDEQGAGPVDRDADRPAMRGVVRAEKAGQHVAGGPGRLPAGEGIKTRT